VVHLSLARQHHTAATDAYIRGLREFGWSGSTTQVRIASAVAAALVTGSWCGLQVSELCSQHQPGPAPEDPTWPQQLAAKHRITTDAALDGWAATFSYLLDLGDTASRLADTITPCQDQ
jgi:hypothetical protein